MLHRRATIGCGGILVNHLVDPLGLASGPSAVGSEADIMRGEIAQSGFEHRRALCWIAL
jgi:hypothetical protein